MIRQDKDFQNQYTKEQKITNFLSSNGFMETANPIYITDEKIQQKGVDLSCSYNDKNFYLDFKLKNSGNTNRPTKPSDRWSIEIARYKGDILSGWFTQSDSMTNVYCFLDAFGSSFDDISAVSCTYFEKQKMKDMIEADTGKTIEDIYDDAVGLLKSDERLIRYTNNFQLYKSYPDRNYPVVNVCFNRDLIKSISHSKLITK